MQKVDRFFSNYRNTERNNVHRIPNTESFGIYTNPSPAHYTAPFLTFISIVYLWIAVGFEIEL